MMMDKELIESAKQGNENAAILVSGYCNLSDVESNYDNVHLLENALAKNPSSIGLRLAIADCYYFGNGVEKDIEKAIQLYRECNRINLGNYGLNHATDLDNKNNPECVEWMKMAFEKGNSEAGYRLAGCYTDGKYMQPDTTKYITLLKDSYECGSDDAGIDLGYEYVCGHEINPDIGKGINILKTIANRNNTKACLLLYRIYSEGIGVLNDNHEAEHWIKKAAEKGNEQGMYQYGLMLINCTITEKAEDYGDRLLKGVCYLRKAYNLGVEKAGDALLDCYIRNLEEKKQSGSRSFSDEEINQYEFLKKKADEGNPKAQLFVGKMLLAGFMADQDITIAYDWIKKAADGGNIEAKELLAERYGDANSSSVDYYKAEQLYNEIIESDDGKYKPLALNNLAFINFNVIDNKTKAFSLWKQAAELDDRISAYNLGILYYYGYGTEINRDKAKYWIRKSADWGYGQAQNEYTNLFIDGSDVLNNESSTNTIKSKSDIPEGAWKCPKCGSINEAGKGMCPMCGAVKGFY